MAETEQEPKQVLPTRWEYISDECPCQQGMRCSMHGDLCKTTTCVPMIISLRVLQLKEMDWAKQAMETSKTEGENTDGIHEEG